ncbi:MAG: hypothetical protein H6909_04930 [Rickettsiaceae bacterium]|nr:hypothetical protein [Rickettsiaceae bacterium]
MLESNIENQNYYRVASAIKNQDIIKLIQCIKAGIVKFDISYGPCGTILDYGFQLNNMEMLSIIYLAILNANQFTNLTFHPRQINQQFIEIIQSFEGQHDPELREKLEFKIAIMLDLNLIDFTSHIPNLLFHSDYKILDLALSLFSSYIFEGLIDYLLKTGVDENQICKLISFDIIANKMLFDSRSSLEMMHLIKSKISNEYIIHSLSNSCNMSINWGEQMIKNLSEVVTLDDFESPEFISYINCDMTNNSGAEQ